MDVDAGIGGARCTKQNDDDSQRQANNTNLVSNARKLFESSYSLPNAPNFDTFYSSLRDSEKERRQLTHQELQRIRAYRGDGHCIVPRRRRKRKDDLRHITSSPTHSDYGPSSTFDSSEEESETSSGSQGGTTALYDTQLRAPMKGGSLFEGKMHAATTTQTCSFNNDSQMHASANPITPISGLANAFSAFTLATPPTNHVDNNPVLQSTTSLDSTDECLPVGLVMAVDECLKQSTHHVAYQCTPSPTQSTQQPNVEPTDHIVQDDDIREQENTIVSTPSDDQFVSAMEHEESYTTALTHEESYATVSIKGLDGVSRCTEGHDAALPYTLFAAASVQSPQIQDSVTTGTVSGDRTVYCDEETEHLEPTTLFISKGGPRQDHNDVPVVSAPAMSEEPNYAKPVTHSNGGDHSILGEVHQNVAQEETQHAASFNQNLEESMSAEYNLPETMHSPVTTKSENSAVTNSPAASCGSPSNDIHTEFNGTTPTVGRPKDPTVQDKSSHQPMTVLTPDPKQQTLGQRTKLSKPKASFKSPDVKAKPSVTPTSSKRKTQKGDVKLTPSKRQKLDKILRNRGIAATKSTWGTGIQLYNGRSLERMSNVKKCKNKFCQFEPRAHGLRAACERCWTLASTKEREEFIANGRHLRIQLVRGGCPPTCTLFPANHKNAAEKEGVRLCRRCFDDMHHVGIK